MQFCRIKTLTPGFINVCFNKEIVIDPISNKRTMLIEQLQLSKFMVLKFPRYVILILPERFLCVWMSKFQFSRYSTQFARENRKIPVKLGFSLILCFYENVLTRIFCSNLVWSRLKSRNILDTTGNLLEGCRTN